MCNFLSALAFRNGDVFTNDFTDSHDHLLELAGVREQTGNEVCRVEFTPGKNVGDPAGYTLVVDESREPEWFVEVRERVENKLRAKVAAMTIATGYHKLICGGCWIIGGDAHVDVIIAGRVFCVYGSATIGIVYGSATIGNVYGSAKIGNVYGSATIGNVYGSATINDVYGSATIGNVGDSAKIGNVGDSATIGIVGGSAKIGNVSGSAKIGDVYDSAKIKKDMRTLVRMHNERLAAEAGETTLDAGGNTEIIE